MGLKTGDFPDRIESTVYFSNEVEQNRLASMLA